MIIDIRGTHGSGKSWLIHQLIATGRPVKILEKGTQIGTALKRWDAAVVGKYANVCGGCDQVGSADEVCRRVRLFNVRYRIVLLEGILVSHTFKRYRDLAVELGDYTFCFLDTPLQECLRRVQARRHARGDSRPLKPDNIVKDWHGVWERVQGQVRAAGLRAIVLPWRNPLPTLLKELDHD